MGRGKNPVGIEKGNYGDRLSDAKRERPARYQPSKLPNIDVHGILFAIVAVVFVLYPLAQYFLGLYLPK